jgi:hypothetical protein
LRPSRASDSEGEQPAAIDGPGKNLGIDQVAASGPHEQGAQQDCHGGNDPIGFLSKLVCPAAGGPSQHQQVQRHEEDRNHQQAATGRKELPVIQRVLTGTEQGGGQRGEHQEGKIG